MVPNFIIMGTEILNEYQLKIDFGINGIIRKDEVVPFSNFLPKTISKSFLSKKTVEGKKIMERNLEERRETCRRLLENSQR